MEAESPFFRVLRSIRIETTRINFWRAEAGGGDGEMVILWW